MTRFRLWAPRASSVELQWRGGRVPLCAGSGGQWFADVPEAGPGTDYGFHIDGSGPWPDPRSAWQPRGPDGPSRVVDHGSFTWSDAGWNPPAFSTGVVYELHVGTFTPAGTFDAALGRIGHLVDLGVTHVELMPVAEFPGERGWGYDTVAPFAPHHRYGGPEGLKRFVDACHAAGLAVLLDVVCNHVGPGGERLRRFGPYLREEGSTPWGPALDLDGPQSVEVRRFVLDAALAWLRAYHADGLRLDAVDTLRDASAIHLLEQLVLEVRALAARLGRSLVLIAESSANDPRLVTAQEAGGLGLDAQWNGDFHHALHALLTGERAGYYADFGSLAALAKCLEQTFVLDGQHSAYRGRRHGQSAAHLPRDRFVACLQDHDQVGNRPRGERSARLLDLRRLKTGAALLLTSPFVPLLFQGEEWGASAPFPYFCDHGDAALARAVREGRRRELSAFGWTPNDPIDPGALETFEQARLDWNERAREPHASLLRWHRDLIRLRRALTVGRPGERPRVRFDEGERWFLAEQGWGYVACNLGAAPRRLPAPEGSRLLLTSEPEARITPGGLELPPDAVAVLCRQDRRKASPTPG